MRQDNAALGKEGWQPVDVAGSQSAAGERYAAVWVRGGEGERRLYVGVAEDRVVVHEKDRNGFHLFPCLAPRIRRRDHSPQKLGTRPSGSAHSPDSTATEVRERTAPTESGGP